MTPPNLSLTSLLRHVRYTLIQGQHILFCSRGGTAERSIISQRVISRRDKIYEGVKTVTVPSTYFWTPVRILRVLLESNVSL